MVELGGRKRPAEEPHPEKRRVLVAGIFHQTNVFVGGRTGLEDFEIRRRPRIASSLTRPRSSAPITTRASSI